LQGVLVMLIRNFGALPCYGPETETGTGVGTDAGTGGAAPPPAATEGADQGTGEGEGEGQQQGERQEGRQARKSVRQELDAANEGAKKRQAARDQQGRFQGQEGQQQPGTQEGQQQEGQTQQQQVAAPEAWAKEAKAAWAQVPPAAQAAILKREQDVSQGVENLKRGYKELDDALKPYMGAIQEHKTTPGAAVKQLFDWMLALTNEAKALKSGQAPQGVFAALAQSYGIDPVKLLAHMVQNPVVRQQQNGQQPNGQTQLDPAIQAYLDQKLAPLGQNLNGLYQTVQQQSIAKTNEMLAMWAKDKPFYNDVRVTMARLMTPGQNGEPPLVAPREDGNADLDTAYERACNMDPNVRAKMKEAGAAAEAKAAADKLAAEKAAQRTKLEAARKASGSIPISAPGMPGDGKQKGVKRGKSVRESLSDAIKEVTDRAG
jgi:hypothetical protein